MRSHVQWLRRVSQLAALALVVAVALAAGRRAAQPEYGPTPEAGVLESVRGNTWSLQVGPLSLTDPLAGLDSLVAAKAPVAALWVGLALPVLATVLLGRVFCSWVCPAGFLLELNDGLRSRVRRLARRPQLGLWRGDKYALLGAGLALAALLSAPLLGLVYAPAVLVREVHAWAFAAAAGAPFRAGVTWGTVFLLGIGLAELFASRRAWCRALCPGGALYGLLGAGRVARVAPPDARCDRCGQCATACGMGLNPMRGVTGLECDNCLACLSHCPPAALHLRWRAPAPAARD